jgi:TIR domain-containing protein
MATIFISYRRGDTKAIVGRLYDRLDRHFGKSSIFMDIETLRPGTDFGRHIEAVLERCNVVLAVIGPQWSGTDGRIPPRLFDEDDWVRLEIDKALQHGIPIIPVVVDSMPMLKPAELPPSLRAFANLHAIPLDSGRDFNVHVNRIIHAVEEHLGWRATLGRRRWAIPLSASVALGGAWYLWRVLVFDPTIDSQPPGQEFAVRACNSAFTLRCAQQGGAFGSSQALTGLKNCIKSEIRVADEPALRWRDVWTTDIYSYAPGGGGPGGGRDDDELKVGGWGDWYFSLIQFDLPPPSRRPHFASLALYSKSGEAAGVPLEVDRIIQRWDFPKGERLWWKDRPGARAVTTEPLPAPRPDQWYIVDLTTLVQEWFDGRSINFGIQIRPTSNFGSFVVFVSSDAADKTKIPRLILCT